MSSDTVPASAPRFTPQQAAAIATRDVSVGLSAGAGCGKTFVLTRRFLSHLEPGPDSAPLSSLVAITFTERAAREMRERVRGLCHARLLSAPQDEVTHWTRVVRELDSARISTIHSFCATVLRSHAVEAGLDPRFGLVSESLGTSFRDKALRDFLFSRLSAREDDDAEDLVYRFGIDRLLAFLPRLIGDLNRIRVEDWENITSEGLVNLWTQKLIGEVVPSLIREFCDSPEATGLLALFRRELPLHPRMAEAANVLLELIPGLPNSRDLSADLARLDEEARLHRSTANHWPSAEDHAFARDAMSELRDRAKRIGELLLVNEAMAIDCAQAGLTLFRLARCAKKAYDTTKREQALLEFDDLLVLTRNLLRDHPRVAQRLSAGIRLLMVDEFQDTDPVQVEIVRSLCGGNALEGRLFFVGDAKQSIYRFRGAEPRVFADLRSELPRSGRLPLSLNFRSQPAILGFVNALFDGELGEEYEPLEPTVAQLTPEPAIEFLFRPVVSNAPADETEVGPVGGDSPGASARRRAEAEWIASRIRAWLDSQEPLVREKRKDGTVALRPVKPRDIVLLFRAMSDVRMYEEALREAGIDHYVIGGQAFFAQQEVFDLAHLCRAVEDTGDEVALLGVLRSPAFGLADDTLLLLGSAGLGLWAALRAGPPAGIDDLQREALLRAAATLSELRTAKDNRSIAEWLELALQLTGYDATLLGEHLGPRKLANIRKLIDLAREFDAAGGFSLSDFAAGLTDAVHSEAKEPLAATHPESSDVVRLMTVHQSKGLEFPIVFVTDLDRRSRPSRVDALIDPELGPLVSLGKQFGEETRNVGVRVLTHRESAEDAAESLRLLYVALTRAADVLVLSTSLGKNGTPVGPWLKFLAKRFNLDTGEVLLDSETGAPFVPERSRRGIPHIHVHTTSPSEGSRESRGASGLSPARFREIIDTAQPSDWPVLAVPVGRRFGADWRTSVSDLEAALGDIPPAQSWFAGPGLGSVSFTQHTAPAKPSRRKRSDQPDVDAEQLGTLVHGVLEIVSLRDDPDIPPIVDIDSLVTSAWGRTDRPLPEGLRLAANAQVSGWLATSLRTDLAKSPNVQREIPFLIAHPAPTGLKDHSPFAETRRVLVAGTVDLLYQVATDVGDTWRIIDYKTSGPILRSDAPSLLARYELQLGLYCLALHDWLGVLPARISLVLLRGGVQEIAFTPDSEFLTHTRTLLDQAVLAAASQA